MLLLLLVLAQPVSSVLNSTSLIFSPGQSCSLVRWALVLPSAWTSLSGEEMNRNALTLTTLQPGHEVSHTEPGTGGRSSRGGEPSWLPRVGIRRWFCIRRPRGSRCHKVCLLGLLQRHCRPRRFKIEALEAREAPLTGGTGGANGPHSDLSSLGLPLRFKLRRG